MLAGISALQNIVGTQKPFEAAAPAVMPAAQNAIGQSFADALGSSAMNTVSALQNAETASIKGIQGGMETREVVDAVMSAERSLQAAIAIRDKIVSSYLEISRMQI